MMTTPDNRPRLLIGGEWAEGTGAAVPVLDKFTREPAAEFRVAGATQVARMIDAAQAGFEREAPPGHDRSAVLDRAAAAVADEAEDLIATMQTEAGFTRSDAAGEVARCQQTLRLSGEEARRLAGEVIPMAGVPGQAHRFAFTFRVPLGVVLAVTPFNSPLNTVAHKLAPAFAAGNPVILKPSSATPMTACRFADILLRAGMPQGFLSIILGGGEVVSQVMADPRVRFVAFTGSTDVGAQIQAAAGLRRTQMELGSIAFTILNDDADLEKALPKVVAAGYRKAGQVCTSIQRLLVHRSIEAEVTTRLTDLVGKIVHGDPRAADTFTGPLISEDESIRVERWIAEARAGGARLLTGGARTGSVLAPALLTGVSDEMRLGCAEVFGPVMSIAPFDTLDEAIGRVNATPYGLATGLFTGRLTDAFGAARRLRVGGVHINETSSSRVDLMPYGGSKDSGFGREGPRYAVHEMTEERVVSITA